MLGICQLTLCLFSYMHISGKSLQPGGPWKIHLVGLGRTCPEPGGIFPDQGSIENTLSPASSAGGFFTTGSKPVYFG